MCRSSWPGDASGELATQHHDGLSGTHRRDKTAWVRVGRTTEPRAARFSPEDHNGGDACIGYPAFNGEFLTTSAAPAAGDATPVGRGWCLPAAGWERSGPHAPRPVEQRHPDPPPNG